MNKEKIIIVGGSGFLGISLAKELTKKGYDVVILARKRLPENVPARHVFWDGKTMDVWAAELDGAKAVINLTGKNVNCRYNTKNLREINESRTDSVCVIGQAINACVNPPDVWVQAASLAIYGDAGEKNCEETTAPGQGIPVETCLLWEKAFELATTPRTRKVLFRISFVLGKSGGALPMLTFLTKAFLGGGIGSGKQYISWIHENDMNHLWLRAIEEKSMLGVYNVTSPHAVTNAEFMRTLRHEFKRPWSPPTPAFLVPIGCFFLRTEPVLALTGRKGVPAKLQAEGFKFEFTDLAQAIHQINQSQTL